MSSYDPDYLEEMDRQSIQAFEDMVEERAFFQDAIESSIMEEYIRADKDFTGIGNNPPQMNYVFIKMAYIQYNTKMEVKKNERRNKCDA